VFSPSFSRVPTAAKVNQPTNKTPVVAIIGAGPAGGTCAEKLREQGFIGRIIVRFANVMFYFFIILQISVDWQRRVAAV
jgi:NADPH-dependent 2,4-dienoyl-CoA reductase/sulfur reductase-like enzyme